MRTIERTNQFKRDYKKHAQGVYKNALKTVLIEVITALAHDQPLAEKYRDHALTGDWKDHRDCHIKPDLVLIYRTPNPDTLQLIRLGTHSQLSL